MNISFSLFQILNYALSYILFFNHEILIEIYVQVNDNSKNFILLHLKERKCSSLYKEFV